MKKIAFLITLLIAAVLPNVSGAQTATNTTSVLKTGVWEGTFVTYNSGESKLKLNIESVTGKDIKAEANFVDYQNSIVELKGEIVDSFGDFVEQSRWQFAAKDKKFKDGTWIKFHEIKLVQGNSELKQTYYVFVADDNGMGCWYYADDPQPRGRLELKAPAE